LGACVLDTPANTPTPAGGFVFPTAIDVAAFPCRYRTLL
jgi:hypothetical protein